MPIYEYTCRACGARVSLFFRSISSVTDPKCDRCGSGDLDRLMSRVTVLRAAGDLSSLDDDGMMSGFDENDPRAMAAWARRMRQEMGDEGGPEMDEMIDRLERGESLDGDFGEDYGDDGLDDI